MQEAWKEVAPQAIEMIEFVMDIRKGEWTEAQIETKMNNINNIVQEIQKAKENGNWFARIVTSSNLEDIQGFIRTFSTLQDFVDYATKQQSSLMPATPNPFKIKL